MNRHELAKVLLDEIVRTRAQLVRLQMVLARPAEEGISRMCQCEECERLWKAYQAPTIESVQFYEELRSISEDQGLEKLAPRQLGPKLLSGYARKPGKNWPNIRQQPGIGETLAGHGIPPAPPQKAANSRVAIRFRPQERYTQYARKPKVKHLRRSCTKHVPFWCLFQRIEKDRDFAPAFAGLADTYLALLDYRYIAPNEALGLATAAAVNALRLDERLADGHTSQAHAKMHALDWRGAEQEFQKAIQLGPGYAVAHFYYANFLTGRSRFDEAIAEAHEAVRLDPVSMVAESNLANLYSHAGRYGEALES